jgi:N-methylhydantoinase A
LWSIANNENELKIKSIIEKEWPELQKVVLSSEVNPCIREYRRWVSAAMDASLRNLVSNYAKELNDRLNEKGFVGEVGMLNSSGGVISANDISEKPLSSLDSGPALAPVCAREIVNRDLEEDNIVVMDMGGTSFDVSCIQDNEISVSREAVIGWETPGISRVDVHSIGAGGGSIAWVDPGGMIRVGPHSSGSMPGPACYNRGGTQPTVTDANVVLGYINPDNFNAGRMKLDFEKARKAIKENIANPMGMSTEEAAFTIITTVNANMVAAIKLITIEQGIDPRQYIMFCGGGAGSLHAISLADGLDMRKILIPKTAGALSATGGVYSDIVSEYSKSFYTESRNFNYDSINNVLSDLYEEAERFLIRQEIDEKDRSYYVYLEGRYPNQVWEISIRIDDLIKNKKITEKSLARIVERFHEEHEKVFAVKEDTYIECIFWRISAFGSRRELANKEIMRASRKATGKAEYVAKYTSRNAYFKKNGGMSDTPVYDGSKLRYGHEIIGPAIIEEPTTSILIEPDYLVRVTPFNNYYIRKE